MQASTALLQVFVAATLSLAPGNTASVSTERSLFKSISLIRSIHAHYLDELGGSEVGATAERASSKQLGHALALQSR